ncbi:MAG TPA: insulinase family protein, partial [Thermoanaerobaculia bacterium]|nr:insulinase family protein [Thermoanaerobaculia bacterium]
MSGHRSRLLAALLALVVAVGAGAWSAAQAGAQATRAESPAPAVPGAATAAPAAEASAFELDRALPVDPALRLGRLENGLRYYVRANSKPEDRAELRLVVNAGSILEDDSQRGLAHFAEHMAFNGTRRFERQELVDYLEGIGMRFGPDLNAYTGFDQTVYMLQVPTD